MADFALFLKCSFNGNGNFPPNARQTRRGDTRFWSMVQMQGGVLTAVGNSSNADTTSIQVTARGAATDNLYFAVQFVPPGPIPAINSISIMCAINPVVVGNHATKGSPFRRNGLVQLNFSSNNFTNIASGGDIYSAIGPYPLNKDPGPQVQRFDCCFHKLTLVVSATNGGVTQEFSYDPDMDVEMDL